MIKSIPSTCITDPQVLIIGGGPTGLTLAIVLSRAGITCRIIDREPDYHVHSRGKGIQPRTLEVFDDLGIVDELRVNGTSSGSVRFYTNKQAVADVRVPDITPPPGIPYPSLVIIPQFQTERFLRERLADFGVAIERGRELVAFQDDGDGVSVSVKDSATGQVEVIQTDYLVGCDGGRSLVRRQLGLSFEGENHDQYWVLGDIDIEGLPTDVAAHAWFADDNSYLNASKLPGMPGWQVQASIRPNAAGQVEPASEELFQQLFNERSGLPNVRVGNATWLSNYHVKQRMVGHYRKGRVFVAGDAAHIHSPAGGQGLNTGVQDAYNLGWKLALVLQDRAKPELLETYEEERLPIAQGVLRKSETGNNVFFSANPVIAFFRQFVFLPLLRRPRVTTALLLKTAQLDLNYRGGSLAWEDSQKPRRGRSWFTQRRKLRAGDRAPDARLVDGHTGTPTRLFDAFRGPHWTLLLFTGQSVDGQSRLAELAERVVAAYGDVVRPYLICSKTTMAVGQKHTEFPFLGDALGEAQRLYNTESPTLVLVRPDGYIALRNQGEAEQAIFSYCSEVVGLKASQALTREPVFA